MLKLESYQPTVKIEPKISPVKSNVETVQTQKPLVNTGNLTKVGESNTAAALVKNSLNQLFDRLPKLPPAPASFKTPDEGLKEIDALPKPDRKGIPGNLPPEDRQDIYDSRVQTYNEKRAAIADDTVNNATPPKRSDFKNLPRSIAEVEYRDALNNYNTQVNQLKQISREAKQANLENDAEFKKLTPETQQSVRDSLVKNQENPQDVDTLVKLAKSPGFNQLNAEEQKHLINFVGGTNRELSQGARTELKKILDDPTADKSNPETFRKFLTDQPGLPFVVSGSIQPGEFDSRRRPYTVTGPEDVKGYGFASGSHDAQKYTVEVDGKKIDVYIGKDQDPKETYHTIDDVAKGLAALPKASLDKVVSVRVDPQRNPDDKHWEKEYGIPGFRSYMTAGADGNISIYPGRASQEVLDGSLIHETGHTLSKQLFGENTDNKLGDAIKHIFGQTTWSDWKDAMQKDGINPSVYAHQSASKGAPDEDFSETLELYMKVKGTPQEAEIRAIMPERFALLDKILK